MSFLPTSPPSVARFFFSPADVHTFFGGEMPPIGGPAATTPMAPTQLAHQGQQHWSASQPQPSASQLQPSSQPVHVLQVHPHLQAPPYLQGHLHPPPRPHLQVPAYSQVSFPPVSLQYQARRSVGGPFDVQQHPTSSQVSQPPDPDIPAHHTSFPPAPGPERQASQPLVFSVPCGPSGSTLVIEDSQESAGQIQVAEPLVQGYSSSESRAPAGAIPVVQGSSTSSTGEDPADALPTAALEATAATEGVVPSGMPTSHPTAAPETAAPEVTVSEAIAPENTTLEATEAAEPETTTPETTVPDAAPSEGEVPLDIPSSQPGSQPGAPPRLRRRRALASARQESSPATLLGSQGRNQPEPPTPVSTVSKTPAPTADAVGSTGSEDGGASRECAICMDAVVDTVFVPCGHMATCADCGKKLNKRPCPVCRKKIKIVQRVYIS